MQLTDFLPTTKKECELRGWDELDVILFSGDAYVDHPSFGAAVIGRTLEAAGYLSVVHERSVGKPEQVIRTLTRIGGRFRPFGDVHLLQPFDQAVDAFDFPGDSHSYFVHGLFAPRNIYQADLLKLLQKELAKIR